MPDPLLSPFASRNEPFAGLVFLPRRPVDGSRKFPDEPVVANKACPVDQYPGGRDKAFEGIAQEVRQTVERILAGGGESRRKRRHSRCSRGRRRAPAGGRARR